MPRDSLLLLAGSGALAAGFGDMLWFRSLVVLGPRVGMLIMSLCPVATAVLAYASMREALGATQIAGMLLTVGGVAWVIAEGRKRQSWQRPHGSSFAGGVFCAVTSTILVAAGMVMSRMALAGRADVSAFSGSLVRVAAASVFALLAMLATGRAGQLVAAVKDARAMRIILAGTVVGPVVGIWLSQVAIKLAPSGVATAMIGTSPVMMVPLAYLFFGERPTASAVAGAVLATAGVAVMIVR
jgi:drug/metabolite transporter (DMT)-like permease